MLIHYGLPLFHVIEHLGDGKPPAATAPASKPSTERFMAPSPERRGTEKDLVYATFGSSLVIPQRSRQAIAEHVPT